MEVIVTRGDSKIIDKGNLSQKQMPSYLNLKIKVKLVELLGGTINHNLINDAVDSIDFTPFTKMENEDQKLLLINIITYQFMIRGFNIKGYVTEQLMKEI